MHHHSPPEEDIKKHYEQRFRTTYNSIRQNPHAAIDLLRSIINDAAAAGLTFYVIESYTAMAEALRLTNSIEEAVSSVEHSITLIEQTGNFEKKESATVRAYNIYGNLLRIQEQYISSEKYLLKAFQIAQTIKKHDYELMTLVNLGTHYEGRGMFATAAEYFIVALRSLEDPQKPLPTAHARLKKTTLINLANLALQSNDYGAAEGYLKDVAGVD
jgi:tetratricopeptide (TPR) repeat protein